MTLDVIMVQLQCMDACLDTLTVELNQVNTHVGRIARWQARLGGFMKSHSSPLESSKDDDDSDDNDDDKDGDVSSSSIDEMST